MNSHVVRNQRGAALIVGLIVLLVMTLIGVSSLSLTTTELKMAGNLQSYDISFQAADAVINQTLWTDDTVDWSSDQPMTVNYAALDSSSEAQATIEYLDCRLNPKGFSLTMDDTFKGVVHKMTAEGKALNSFGIAISTSKQEMGIESIRPGCPQI